VNTTAGATLHDQEEWTNSFNRRDNRQLILLTEAEARSSTLRSNVRELDDDGPQEDVYVAALGGREV
jgi:hypothetical protein